MKVLFARRHIYLQVFALHVLFFSRLLLIYYIECDGCLAVYTIQSPCAKLNSKFNGNGFIYKQRKMKSYPSYVCIYNAVNVD